LVCLFVLTGKAWIGLYDELYNSWKWSLDDSSFYGDGEYTFRNWYPGSPNDLYGPQLCVRLISVSDPLCRWDDRQCSDVRMFVCYNGRLSKCLIRLSNFCVSSLNIRLLSMHEKMTDFHLCISGTVDGTPSFVLSNVSLNWTEAQMFCRKNYVDLARYGYHQSLGYVTPYCSLRTCWQIL